MAEFTIVLHEEMQSNSLGLHLDSQRLSKVYRQSGRTTNTTLSIGLALKYIFRRPATLHFLSDSSRLRQVYP